MRTDVLSAWAMNQADFARDAPLRLFRRMLARAEDRSAENGIAQLAARICEGKSSRRLVRLRLLEHRIIALPRIVSICYR